MNQEKLPGGCLCGAVRYEIDARVDLVCHCHCTLCQKAHGAAFGSYTPVPRDRIQVRDDAGTLGEYRSSPGVVRRFCSSCGSPLIWDEQSGFPDTVFVSVASLDVSIQPPRQRHIHVSTRVPWYEFSDRWPQSEDY